MSRLPYVYILFDFMGVPFYVGKGTGNRDMKHELTSDPKNFLKNEQIERTWIVLGEVPKTRIIHASHEAAFAAEIALISVIGRIDLGTGPLTNLTAGGDGIDSASAQRAALHRKWTLEQQSAVARRYALFSPEQRKEFSRRRLITFTAEKRKIAAQKRLETLGPDRLREIALNASNKMTSEQRSKNGKQAVATRLAIYTSEQRSEQQRQAAAQLPPGWHAENLQQARAARKPTTPEERSEYVKRGWASLTDEQRHERSRRMHAGKTPEQRSDAARLANAAMTAEQRSERSRRINAALTAEQRRANCLKAREARKLQTIMYNSECFSSRAALARYLAPKVNRSIKAVYSMLTRYDDDGVRVVRYYNGLRANSRQVPVGRTTKITEI